MLDAGIGFDGDDGDTNADEQGTRQTRGGLRTWFGPDSSIPSLARRSARAATVTALTGACTGSLIQPAAVEPMVQVLLGAATGEIGGSLTEVAGPRREHLSELSVAYADWAGDPVNVVAAPIGELVRNGVLLPNGAARSLSGRPSPSGCRQAPGGVPAQALKGFILVMLAQRADAVAG